MFSNRADYTWGIDGKILWLKDHGTECRSLTNDIENCLVEISEHLPEGKELVNYRIIYRDSEGEWDGICILNDSTLSNDVTWLKYRTERNQPYYSHIEISFFPVQETSYELAKEAILANERYKHYR
jgi:hypothetical protein